jgi:hypothetical protein
MGRRLMIAGAMVGVLGVAGGAIALLGRSGGQVPVIQADDRPIRVKPDDPGGLRIAGLNNEIYGEGETTGKSRLAPPAEAPDPAALRAATAEPRPAARAEPNAAAPREVPAATGKPVPAAAPAPSAGKPAPAAAPASPAAKPNAATPAAQAASAPQTAPPAGSSPPAATPAPVPRTAVPDAGKPATEAEPDRRPGSTVAVQLAAVQSEGAAQAEWRSLRNRMPDLFGVRQPSISRTERDGRTFWRVRTTGFADMAEARSFCDRVRAKGAACAVAAF